MSYSDDYLDLSEYIPQEAIDIRDAQPDIRATYPTVSAADAGYDNRSGDLANLIKSAAANNEIVDLGSGTYEMETGVSESSGTVGVIGDGSDVCEVYYNGVDVSYLFFLRGANTFVLEGVTFDITEPAPNGLDTDVGLANTEIDDECWCEDIELRGKRHYRQDYDGDGDVEAPSQSRRMTFLIEMATYDGTSYIHNCRFPDGGTDEAWRSYVGTVGHAIGPNADPGHIGTNVWHECYAANFMDNGFYVNNSPGPNILWDCTARNCRAGNFRLGNQDYVVGGYSEITDLPNDALGQCLGLTGGSDIQVYGLELYADSAEHVSDSMLQIRPSDAGENINAHLEKVVGHLVAGERAVRINGYGTTFQDCYFLDENSHGEATLRARYSTDHDTTANDLHVHNENGDGVSLDSSQTFSHNGTTFDGPGTWSVSEVGFDDPRPLPDFYVSEPEPASEYEVVFRIVDESGATLSGAVVSLEGQVDVTTGSDGIADFGVLPTGDYAYSVVLDDYYTVSGTYTNDRNATYQVSLTEIPDQDGSIRLTATNRDGVGIEGVDVTLYEGT